MRKPITIADKTEALKQIVRDDNISEENTLGFEAAVTILFGLHYSWNPYIIAKNTGYEKEHIITFIDNLQKSNVLVDGKMMSEVIDDEPNPALSTMIEFSMWILCAEGKIVAHEIEDKNVSEETAN